MSHSSGHFCLSEERDREGGREGGRGGGREEGREERERIPRRFLGLGK